MLTEQIQPHLARNIWNLEWEHVNAVNPMPKTTKKKSKKHPRPQYGFTKKTTIPVYSVSIDATPWSN
jgi:hypothetical protein